MDKQVNRICICCDLESGCIFIAIGRVLLTIVFTFALFVCYFNEDLKSQFLGPEVISDGVFHFYTIVSIPLCLVTMICAYWFVRGAKSHNRSEVQAMFYYFGLELVTIVALVARFSVICFVFVGIEFYLLCCSAFLIAERQYLLKEFV